MTDDNDTVTICGLPFQKVGALWLVWYGSQGVVIEVTHRPSAQTSTLPYAQAWSRVYGCPGNTEHGNTIDEAVGKAVTSLRQLADDIKSDLEQAND